MKEGKVLRIQAEAGAERPRSRFRDWGHIGALNLFSHDQIFVLDDSEMLEGFPFVEGVIVIATWNSLHPKKSRVRHAALIPNFSS